MVWPFIDSLICRLPGDQTHHRIAYTVVTGSEDPVTIFV